MYEKAPLSHPLDQAITTNVYLSLRHHTINLVQYTITQINFYGGAWRKYYENTFFFPASERTSQTNHSEWTCIVKLKFLLN